MTHAIINRFNDSIVSVGPGLAREVAKTEGEDHWSKKEKKGITLISNWVAFMRDTDEKEIIDIVNLFKAKK